MEKAAGHEEPPAAVELLANCYGDEEKESL